MTAPIRIGIQAGMLTASHAWLEFARRVEVSGFDAMYVSDHPGVTGSPFVALAAVAAVTSTLKLGTYVCNTGVRDPLQVASDAAAVDVMSDGRFVLGVGAGHTPVEWTMAGVSYPSPKARVARFGEFVEVVSRLLDGEVVTYHGEYLHTDDAFLLSPRPVQARLPILVGGNGLQLLRSAGTYADIVSLTGLGKTLEDGHRHTADWAATEIDERVKLLRDVKRTPPIVLDALVQHVEITQDRAAVAERVASMAPGLDPATVLDSPYALIGTVDEIVHQLGELRERWGFTSYVVRADALDALIPVVKRVS